MKVNWNNGKQESDLQEGGFEKMMEMRKKALPRSRKGIQDALANYDGGNICIVTIREDENGDPEGAEILMTGVGTTDSQIAMSKALRDCSEKAMEVLMDSASGNTKAMMAIAKGLIKDIDNILGEK